ncbi:3-isopropylmalate dehydratase large subunit [Campylobacter sp. 2018MI13]|uniref:3-isopropylmalate dehydratase large subunit n=1 Tax=Campylobacter sp. 2018MI13 TaxID=2836737 RepID=UPI001BDABEE0|nr:3-isopropylmalate dehydratase large subunit [Campylobacter sp. 2018MI13]MBT0881907.1 3-isopropylmalate dehydratase large subunit [Campylobacter sp. 2018MI13]
MTLTEQIFAHHIGKEVKAGEIIDCPIDMVIGNDITTPISIKQFKKSGATRLANPDGFAIVLDHYIPAKDILSANQAKISRDFAKEHNLKYLFDEKNMGIEHALLPENGLISPGDVIIGADSHTCTHGALGAFATGMGSTDLAYAMITGKNWFKVPSAIKVQFRGKLKPWVYGKDLILEIIRILGVDGALYKSLEFFGIEELDMDSRFSLCNMAIEAGAKNGICAVDNVTREFLNSVDLKRKGVEFSHLPNAVYERVIEIDLDKLDPVVAYPFLPSNGKSIKQAVSEKVKIDQAFVGSCTNGRLSDLRIAASILKDKKVHSDVRMIITPATTKIALQAQKEGLMDIFASAGAVVSNPTCGACLGGYMGILADGERCISTTNRNFVGRMGARTSEVYLANSAIAAASAIKGYICSPDEL